MSIEVICLAFRWICALSVIWRGSTRSDTFALCMVRGGQAREPTLTNRMRASQYTQWRWSLLNTVVDAWKDKKKIQNTFKLSKWDGRVTKEVKTNPERFKNDGFLVWPRCTENGSWFLLFSRKELALLLLKRTSSWDVRLDIRIINGFIPHFAFR